MTVNLTHEQVKHAIEQTSSLSAAANVLNVNYQTLRKIAKKFNLFVTNQGGKGNQVKNWDEVPFHELRIQRRKDRVLCEALFQCEICTFSKRRKSGKSVIQIDHIDGDHDNWARENLRALCPNCHATESEHFMFYERTHTEESVRKTLKTKGLRRRVK